MVTEGWHLGRTGQNHEKGRSFPSTDGHEPAPGSPMRSAAGAVGAAALLAGLALACARAPARGGEHRADGLPGGRSRGRRPAPRRPPLPVPFDVDGDGLRERVQWTAQEQREGFLWLDANHDDAMQSDELLGRRLGDTGWPVAAGRMARARRSRFGERGRRRRRSTDRDRSRLVRPAPLDRLQPRRRSRSRRALSRSRTGASSRSRSTSPKVSRSTAGSTSRPRGRRSRFARARARRRAAGRGVVTEVHLPLLSAPTAAVGTPVPLA